MKVQIQGKNGPKVVNINRRKSIRYKCLDCGGYEYATINKCSQKNCDLHPFRNIKDKQNAAERKKAIRKYCMWCTVDQRKEIRLCPSITCPLWSYRKGQTTDRTHEVIE